MKKTALISLLLVLLLVITACAKATDTNETETTAETTAETTVETTEPVAKIDMNIAALAGPTGMGMVGLMDSSSKDETANHYNFEITGSPDALIGKIINGELDIAAVPTNLALVLYNKTEGNVQLAAVNTLGVLFVVENGENINSVEDLKGQTIHVSGKGSVPDYVMQYMLEDAALLPEKDVIVDYALEHADLAAAMVAGDVKIGLLPQPHVTTAMMRNPDLRIALDMTEEWGRVTEGSADLVMGAIIVQKAFAQEHPEALNAFLDEYKASVDFVNANIQEASVLIEQYGILPNAAIAEKAIPKSNIVFVDAMSAKASLEAFYKVLFEIEPKSIGGKLADEGFYYNREN